MGSREAYWKIKATPKRKKEKTSWRVIDLTDNGSYNQDWWCGLKNADILRYNYDYTIQSK